MNPIDKHQLPGSESFLLKKNWLDFWYFIQIYYIMIYCIPPVNWHEIENPNLLSKKCILKLVLDKNCHVSLPECHSIWTCSTLCLFFLGGM